MERKSIHYDADAGDADPDCTLQTRPQSEYHALQALHTHHSPPRACLSAAGQSGPSEAAAAAVTVTGGPGWPVPSHGTAPPESGQWWVITQTSIIPTTKRMRHGECGDLGDWRGGHASVAAVVVVVCTRLLWSCKCGNGLLLCVVTLLYICDILKRWAAGKRELLQPKCVFPPEQYKSSMGIKLANRGVVSR